jgi:hypothetical protein
MIYLPGRHYPSGMEARVAVLEKIARSTQATLDRMEPRLDSIDRRIDVNSRWLLGIMLGGFETVLAGFGGVLTVMARGFHWL